MKTIELLTERVEDELNDASAYAKLALEYKDTDPELANLFYKLSGEEMGHMDALHKRVVVAIEKYKQANGEPPAGMKALYDFAHKREIEKMEKVANLQSLFKR